MIAVVVLGNALQINNGFLEPAAILWLTAALLATAVGLTVARAAPTRFPSDGALALFVGAGLCVQFVQNFLSAPGIYLKARPSDFHPFVAGLAIAAVVSGTLLARSSLSKHLQVLVLVATHLALGFWLIKPLQQCRP